LHLLQPFAHLGALAHERARLRLVLLRLRLPDLLRERVALRLQLLGVGLDLPALLLERLEARDVERVPARREAPRDRLDVRAQQLDVDHFFPAAASRPRSSASFSRILASSPRSVGTYQPGSLMPSGR